MANIKLKDHYWETEGIYDAAQSKTQKAINADIEEVAQNNSDLIILSDTQPTATGNKIWIKEGVSYQIPVMDDLISNNITNNSSVTGAKVTDALNTLRISLDVLKNFHKVSRLNWRAYTTSKAAFDATESTDFTADGVYIIPTVLSGGYPTLTIILKHGTDILLEERKYNATPTYSIKTTGAWSDLTSISSLSNGILTLSTNLINETSGGTATDITTTNENFEVLQTDQIQSRIIQRGHLVQVNCAVKCINTVTGSQIICRLPNPYNLNTVYIPKWATFGADGETADSLLQVSSNISNLYIRNAVAGKIYGVSFMYMV